MEARVVTKEPIIEDSVSEKFLSEFFNILIIIDVHLDEYNEKIPSLVMSQSKEEDQILNDYIKNNLKYLNALYELAKEFSNYLIDRCTPPVTSDDSASSTATPITSDSSENSYSKKISDEEEMPPEVGLGDLQKVAENYFNQKNSTWYLLSLPSNNRIEAILAFLTRIKYHNTEFYGSFSIVPNIISLINTAYFKTTLEKTLVAHPADANNKSYVEYYKLSDVCALEPRTIRLMKEACSSEPLEKTKQTRAALLHASITCRDQCLTEMNQKLTAAKEQKIKTSYTHDEISRLEHIYKNHADTSIKTTIDKYKILNEECDAFLSNTHLRPWQQIQVFKKTHQKNLPALQKHIVDEKIKNHITTIDKILITIAHIVTLDWMAIPSIWKKLPSREEAYHKTIEENLNPLPSSRQVANR